MAAECATVDLLRDQFAAHDAWVDSLKESAEAVLQKSRETREAMPAAGVAEGDDTDTPEANL